MSRVSFEAYEHIASLPNVSNTEASGRYIFQQESERKILFDLLVKLDLKVTDELLEIGCGPGNLILPLSYFCSRATGIDNEASITRLKNRSSQDGAVVCFSGNFLEMNLSATYFDKILIYGVLHCMSNKEEVLNFVERALSILKAGGRMLLGDLPNISKKKRFINSKTGQCVATNYAELLEGQTGRNISTDVRFPDSGLVIFDDAFILDLMAFIRGKGFEAFLVPEPLDLPFGGSREDILVVAHC